MGGLGGSVTGDILRRIPDNSIGAEIGVWMGESSKKFLAKTRHLYLIDSWSILPYKWGETEAKTDFSEWLEKYSFLIPSKDPDEYQKVYDQAYRKVCKRFMDDPVTIYRMTSDQWFSFFNKRIDWIYIDGDHEYEGCLRDLKNSSKITDVIFGDDYGVKRGVTQAVDFFENNMDCIVTRFDMYQYEIKLLK